MFELGRCHDLTVIKANHNGVCVDGGEWGPLWLATGSKNKIHPELGSVIEVFLYVDNDEKIIATADRPLALADEIAVLQVKQVTQIGAFLDWGIPKDLLVPFSEQQFPLSEGQSCVVFVFVDPKTERMVASTRLSRYLSYDPDDFSRGQEVELLFTGESELGMFALINDHAVGLIHRSDIYTDLEVGQASTGYIKKIRDDGQIDLSVQAPGYGKIQGMSGDILERIIAAGGQINVSDKSPPEVVYREFGMSKKAFKKAIGKLYKDRLIVIEQDCIRLPDR
ncbi:MAG: S1-like domain-containing RNA-binding protein [Myxococcota bacterium]|nr:S1-like domain-containing RNA-binding protein [Myxococcota bacterium]